MSKVRWGILGTGRIAQDFTTALSYVPDAEIVAVGSRSMESANAFGDSFSIPKRYGSYDDLAKDPNAQVIYVSTIHPLHYQNALACLQNGKSVLCEKPLTLNAKETEHLITVAREKNLFFMEGMWTRFFPAMVKVRELLKQIGNIHLVICNFGFKNSTTPRLHEPELGGGALLDIGIYPISLISMVYGDRAPSQIHAIAHLNKGIDTQLTVNMSYNSTEMALLALTFHAETPKTATIIGSNGTIEVHGPFWCPTKLTVTMNGKSEELNFPLPEAKAEHKFNFVNSIGMQFEANHVTQKIKEGKKDSDVMPMSESLTIMKTLDTIRKQVGIQYPNELK